MVGITKQNESLSKLSAKQRERERVAQEYKEKVTENRERERERIGFAMPHGRETQCAARASERENWVSG